MSQVKIKANYSHPAYISFIYIEYKPSYEVIIFQNMYIHCFLKNLKQHFEFFGLLQTCNLEKHLSPLFSRIPARQARETGPFFRNGRTKKVVNENEKKTEKRQVQLECWPRQREKVLHNRVKRKSCIAGLRESSAQQG